MSRSKYTDEEKILILQEIESGVPQAKVCRKYQIAPSTVSFWKRRLLGNEAKDSTKLSIREHMLEQENKKLKELLGQKNLEIELLQELIK